VVEAEPPIDDEDTAESSIEDEDTAESPSMKLTDPTTDNITPVALMSDVKTAEMFPLMVEEESQYDDEDPGKSLHDELPTNRAKV
jgi:hypothetical protein